MNHQLIFTERPPDKLKRNTILFEIRKNFEKDIEKYKVVSSVLLKKEITDDKTMIAAAELSAKLIKTKKNIHLFYKATIHPYEELKKEIRNEIKYFDNKCNEIINLIDYASTAYLEQKETERQKREKEISDQQQQLNEQALKDGITPLIIPEIVPEQTKISTISGSITMKAKLVPQVVDIVKAVSNPNFINAEQDFLEKRVLVYARACLKTGDLNIPGVVFNRVNVTQKYTK